MQAALSSRDLEVRARGWVIARALRSAAKAKAIRRELRDFKPGEYYNTDKLERAINRLYTPGFKPGVTIRIAEN